ncbi:MAG: hypothetical protein JRE92_05705 [Deltaproteobacteria bacterium]|jgi:hypothetical protein|nr:hypothetical protein [Deltaproteobacteria bacterium]
MTLANKFFITIVLLGTCLFGAAGAETVPTGFLYEFNIRFGQDLGPTYFAQNDQKNSLDNVSTDDASKTHKEISKPKTSAPENHGSEKTKPVKPFVPSETIPADQGVDLPYDI